MSRPSHKPSHTKQPQFSCLGSQRASVPAGEVRPLIGPGPAGNGSSCQGRPYKPKAAVATRHQSITLRGGPPLASKAEESPQQPFGIRRALGRKRHRLGLSCPFRNRARARRTDALGLPGHIGDVCPFQSRCRDLPNSRNALGYSAPHELVACCFRPLDSRAERGHWRSSRPPSRRRSR